MHADPSLRIYRAPVQRLFGGRSAFVERAPCMTFLPVNPQFPPCKPLVSSVLSPRPLRPLTTPAPCRRGSRLCFLSRIRELENFYLESASKDALNLENW
jgi:hypothetical protein